MLYSNNIILRTYFYITARDTATVRKPVLLAGTEWPHISAATAFASRVRLTRRDGFIVKWNGKIQFRFPPPPARLFEGRTFSPDPPSHDDRFGKCFPFSSLGQHINPARDKNSGDGRDSLWIGFHALARHRPRIVNIRTPLLMELNPIYTWTGV